MSINELRPHIRTLAHTAQIHAFNWMLSQEPTVDDLIADIPTMLDVYIQSAALLAADWYNEQNRDSTYFAFPVDQIVEERLVNAARWVHQGPQRPENRMRTAAHAIVFDAARSTVLSNAQTEGVAVARHEQADACGDCLVRATLAPKASHSRSDDIGPDFHPSCEGMYVPVRKGTYEPPSYTAGWRERIKIAVEAGNTTRDDIASYLNSH